MRASLAASGALPPKPDKNRNAIICDLDVQNPQPMLKARYHRLLSCNTITRPNISDSGPRNSGPRAYANTKIESETWDSTALLMRNSVAMASNAGAIMVELNGDIKA